MFDDMVTIKYYTDPGHGWGAVKRKMLKELGLESSISYFSHEKGETVYLEEDSDLAQFVAKLSERDVIVQFIHKHTDRTSPIRGYKPYKPA